MTATSDCPPPHRLGILANPASGRHEQILGRRPPPSDVPMATAQTFDEVGQALTELNDAGVTLLAIAGGDGTVRNVLTHILLGEVFASSPIIAIIASGSTNMTGHDTGTIDIRRQGWQPLVAFAKDPATKHARLTQRSVLAIQVAPDATPFCGMVIGAGAIDHAVTYTQSQLHSAGLRGSAGPAIAFARFIKALALSDYRHFQTVAMRIHDNHGHTVDDNAMIFVATTLDRLLLRFRPFWGGGDGRLAWSVLAGRARGVLRRLPGAAWGRPGRGTTPANGYTSARADSLELDFDGGFVVDGERFVADSARGPVAVSIAGSASFVSF
ncbi:hypothetical protein HKX42_07680 [Salinisphaera sp. USBA-960]|nr:hypothetical protein [Salifodinibacter halophilus]NNC26751.1 hypothetical protein [Salifodinibacter halophilus]